MVAFSTAGAFVLVPRPTFPHTLPMPDVSTDHVEEFERRQRMRALDVRDGSLSAEARAVGEQLRRIGAHASKRSPVPDALLRSLRQDASQLANRDPVGAEELLNLRALQTELFLQAAQNFVRTKESNSELDELGGGFHRILKRAWLDQNGQLRLSINELRLLFRVHWGELTGLRHHPKFEMAQVDVRRYFAIHLRYPPSPGDDYHSKTIEQMRFVRGLEKADPTYPVSLAIGILALRLGEPESAETALRQFIEARPDGAWGALARNHLRRALAELKAREPQ